MQFCVGVLCVYIYIYTHKERYTYTCVCGNHPTSYSSTAFPKRHADGTLQFVRDYCHPPPSHLQGPCCWSPCKVGCSCVRAAALFNVTKPDMIWRWQRGSTQALHYNVQPKLLKFEVGWESLQILMASHEQGS